MQTVSPVAPHYGLENHGIQQCGHRPLEPLARRSCTKRRSGDARGAGPHRPAGRPHRPVHGPLAQGQVRRPRAVQRGAHLVGQRQPAFRSRDFGSSHERCWRISKARRSSSRTCFVGADPSYRLPVRVITERAWHSLFARNMFIRPDRERAREPRPEFTVIDVAHFQADPGARRHPLATSSSS